MSAALDLLAQSGERPVLHRAFLASGHGDRKFRILPSPAAPKSTEETVREVIAAVRATAKGDADIVGEVLADERLVRMIALQRHAPDQKILIRYARGMARRLHARAFRRQRGHDSLDDVREARLADLSEARTENGIIDRLDHAARGARGQGRELLHFVLEGGDPAGLELYVELCGVESVLPSQPLTRAERKMLWDETRAWAARQNPDGAFAAAALAMIGQTSRCPAWLTLTTDTTVRDAYQQVRAREKSKNRTGRNASRGT